MAESKTAKKTPGAKATAGEKRGTLVIVQRKSGIGFPRRQRAVLRALGLKKLHRPVTQPDNPAIRGMIRKVGHLVEVTEAS